MSTVGQRIKKFRENKGWSQRYGAEKAGMHERALQNYELGLRYPKAEQLEKLSNAFGIDLAFFYPKSLKTEFALFSLLYDMIEKYGDIVIKEEGSTVWFGIDGHKNWKETRMLRDAAKAHEILSIEEFEEWLTNPYEFQNGEYVDLYHTKLREIEKNT